MKSKWAQPTWAQPYQGPQSLRSVGMEKPSLGEAVRTGKVFLLSGCSVMVHQCVLKLTATSYCQVCTPSLSMNSVSFQVGGRCPPSESTAYPPPAVWCGCLYVCLSFLQTCLAPVALPWRAQQIILYCAPFAFLYLPNYGSSESAWPSYFPSPTVT